MSDTQSSMVALIMGVISNIVLIKELVHQPLTLWLYQCDFFFSCDSAHILPWQWQTSQWQGFTPGCISHEGCQSWVAAQHFSKWLMVSWPCFSHTSEEILSFGLSLHQLFFSFSHIICFLEDSLQCLWPTRAAAGRLGWLLGADVPSRLPASVCRHDLSREAF